MLDMFDADTVVRTMCQRPAQLFSIADRGDIAVGNYADLVLVDAADHVVTDVDVVSKCGWTPLDGVTLHHRVVATYVNGELAYNDGQFLPVHAMPLQFKR
jgi:dihydroorotase